MTPELIVVGVSWGGLEALQRMLRALPADFGTPLAIVQHRGKDSDSGLTQVLQRSSPLPVMEIVDKQPVVPGFIYIAPADYHVLVDVRTFALSTDPPVSWARPSIDVLFESAAYAYGRRMIGIILTGAGKDGIAGLCAVKRSGGRTLVQDPATAEARQLPDAAIRACAPDQVLGLEELVAFLVRATSRGRANG